jgi:hypothetical protein
MPAMRQILVYSDSLTWGIIPSTRKRLPFDERWPGVLEIALNGGRRDVRVIEDCLNGRRTVWEDPFKPGRNGLQGLAQRIEINSPPPIQVPRGPIAPKFTGAADKAAGLADAGQHRMLGLALAQFVGGLPGVLPSAAA